MEILEVEELQETIIDEDMIGIDKELIKQKVNKPVFALYLSNVEKAEKKGEISPIVDFYTYLFGKEKTEELFMKYQTFEELNAFLQKVLN